jgi:low temperature requirement protein LtrA
VSELVAAVVVSEDRDRLGALVRFAPTTMLGALLIVVAGFLDGDARIAVWCVALAIDYLGPVVLGVGSGWRIAPEHFAERHGLIVLIALGESIIAIGIGAGFELDSGVIVASAFGVVVVSALWWLYFDVAAIFARRRLLEATGLELHRLALHAYSYLHLPMIAGVVLFALGLKTTVGGVGETLDTVPAVALCAARLCTSWGSSRSFSGSPAGSSAGGRSARPSSWPSFPSRWWSRHSRRSRSSAPCAR